MKKGKTMGVVAYIGPSDLGEGCWVGVEVGVPGGGEHNGTVNGKKYFTCREGQGILVKASEV